MVSRRMWTGSFGCGSKSRSHGGSHICHAPSSQDPPPLVSVRDGDNVCGGGGVGDFDRVPLVEVVDCSAKACDPRLGCRKAALFLQSRNAIKCSLRQAMSRTNLTFCGAGWEMKR